MVNALNIIAHVQSQPSKHLNHVNYLSVETIMNFDQTYFNDLQQWNFLPTQKTRSSLTILKCCY